MRGKTHARSKHDGLLLHMLFWIALSISVAAGGRQALGDEQQVSVGLADPQLVEDLVVANRILVSYGVLDGMGHVSVRHNLDPNRFLLARSRAPELITMEDILEYTLEGVAIAPDGRSQYSERFIHAEIYKARADVGAVVHSHAPAVIPFSVSSVPLRPVYHMASHMLEGIPVFEIRDEFGMTDMLVTNPDRGRSLVEALGDGPSVLMRGHGMVVTGPALPYAVGRSIYTQINADAQLKAIALGGRITYLDPREGQAQLDRGEHRGYSRSWELWKREALATMRGASE